MKMLIKKQMERLDKSVLSEIADFVIEQAVQIQHIPAPTFQEKKRAEYIAKQFKRAGLKKVQMDDLRNVCGVLKGHHSNLPGIMVSAHLDTVFPAETDLTIKKTASAIHGPGIGDNSAGTAGILGLAAYCTRQKIIPARNLLFVATSREEGLGNMGGMRQIFQKLRKQTELVINVEGSAFGKVFTFAPAICRIHIKIKAKGGHSWDRFGNPSANHILCRIGAAIAKIKPPKKPRTTYNIGTMQGGQSVNSIAQEAEMWLDLRSETAASLRIISNQVITAVNTLKLHGVKFKIEFIGDKKPSRIGSDHPLVRGALAALKEVGCQGKLITGSTDARIPLLQGCPAVTIGITRGRHGHRLDEYIKTSPVRNGIAQLIVLTLAMAEYYGDNSTKMISL